MSERVLCYDHKVDPEEVPTYWLKELCPECLKAENATLRRQVEEQAGKLAEAMAERDHDRRLVKLWAEQADALSSSASAPSLPREEA